MSVALTIDDPVNEEEKNYYLPIATERVYKEVWRSAARAFNLSLVDEISVCLDIDEDNVSGFVDELREVVRWSVDNCSKDQSESIKERVAFLIAEITRLMESRDDLSFSIG